MHITKVLNSSVVLTSDNGEESILLGKGIGYGRKAGEEIQLQPSDRVFIPLSNPDAKHMVELLSTIPPIFLELTQTIVADAERTLGVTLSPHIYLMLTDHLNFAIERHKQGIIVTNRVNWQIRHFYPLEYSVGLRGLEEIRARLGEELPEDEATNIAFHLINARTDNAAGYDAAKAARMIADLSNIVFYSAGVMPDPESLHYVRFINHLQFFTQRFFNRKMLDSKDDFLFNQIMTAYPAAMACAEKIRTYMIRSYDAGIPNEEVAYLAIHIARLMKKSDDSGE